MGSLRTLFAISVLLSHSYGYIFVGGRNAVQLFYIISGFLISYVLVERKSYSTKSDFYINRYLRLYPIYFVVAALTLAAYVIASLLGIKLSFFDTYQTAPLSADLLLFVSNITLFFQDWVMFAGIENHSLVFSTNFNSGDVLLWNGLLVPQAWTLGVELTFYLVAPFILPRKRILLTFLVSSVLLRVCLMRNGLRDDPWTYRFFPTELAFFLSGALAHQVLLPFYKRRLSGKSIERLSGISTGVLLFLSLIFWTIPVSGPIKSMALFGIFLLLMPLAFIFQSRHKWDKWIGELSYPIYICHVLVLYGLNFSMERAGISNKIVISLLAVALSAVFAMLLNSYIGGPVEHLRDRFRRGQSLKARPRS